MQGDSEMSESAKRCARAVGFLLISSFLAGAADAQRLWSVGEVSRAPEGPAVVMAGSTVGAGFAGMPVPAEAAEVQVTYDFLRLGMGYLELPLPDGTVIEAENAIFEDRGGGNLMWSGEVSGAGYESVLFTVQDGHLVGWFGEPGGPKYVVYAGPDGRGSLAVEVGPTGDWCGVEAGTGPDLVREVAAAGSRPAAVASQSSDDRLDILVLYTTGTERYWRVIGGPAIGIRQLGDYLNMVFRNGAIPATANLIAVRWDPVLRNHPSTQGGYFVTRPGYNGWHAEFDSSSAVGRLVDRHAPDLVHFIPTVGNAARGAAGAGTLRTTLGSHGVYTGWSLPSGRTFSHEIGHNLGGGHDPPSANKSDHIRPYAFGHTDLSSCAPREGLGDRLLCPATIMSYGTEAYTDGNPNTFASGEPFYSSVRIRPNGWTMGVVGERENERVFLEVVPFVMRVNGGGSRVARGKVAAEWTGVDTVRVTWADTNAAGTNYNGGVDFSEAEGWSDSDVISEGGLTPVAGGVDVRGLRPGGEYRVAVGHNRRSIAAFSGGPVFDLEPPKPAAGVPAAPSNVGGRDNGPGAVRLSWRDNSGVETGYEVWYRKWSGKEPDKVWSRYGERLPAGTRHLDVSGLAAEEEILATVQGRRARIGRYSFVVVAFNARGWSASETFHLEFMPEPYSEPTPSRKVTNCSPRPTGIDLDGYQVNVCLETPDGARRRAWDYQLEADQSGLLYFFNRDNAEILIKVLDGCSINGHRWVFVAPVTTLPFRLQIREPGPYLANRRQVWYYDSERRPQDRIQRNLGGRVGNPKDRTARTVSDTTAFPCTTAEIAAAKALTAGSGSELGFGVAGVATAASPRRLSAGSRTHCEPGGSTLELHGGYRVSMCFETYEGEVGDARDWGLHSSQSGLMYFFDRNNAEVLIKVLDGCGVNGHRWVFVAPVTDLAFNLMVESPDGQRWTLSNRLGRTADAASNVSAFPCSA